MNKFSKKVIFVFKIIILLLIVCLFIALYILNVDNVDNFSKIQEDSSKNISEEKTDKTYAYMVKDNKLYATLNDNLWHEVPVNLDKVIGIDSQTNEIDNKLYQITDEKTMFVYKENKEFMIISSDDGGKNWINNKLEIKDSESENTQPMYVHFVSPNDVKAVICYDVAMQKAMVKIIESSDCGKSWITKKSGTDGYLSINLQSKIVFFYTNLGYISSPLNGGDSAKLYMTGDGGDSFSQVSFQEQYLKGHNSNVYLSWKDIYDFPSIPKKVGNQLEVTVTQGNDGDYLGGKISAKYISNDMGTTWEFIEEYIPN